MLAEMPDAPPDLRVNMSMKKLDLSASLMSADRRRTYRFHVVRMMNRSEEGYRDVAPVVETDGDAVTVSLPGCYAVAPADVLCELACHAFERLSDPSLPLFGPTATAYFRSDVFRRYRMKALGRIADPQQGDAFILRRMGTPFRLVQMFYARMEEELPFLAGLMQVRRMRFIMLAKDVRGEYAMYPDPFMNAVLYDRDALDPIGRPTACMAAMFRSAAYLACYDVRSGRLDGDRFMLMLSMCPWLEDGMRSCAEAGIRLQRYGCERRLMLQ